MAFRSYCFGALWLGQVLGIACSPRSRENHKEFENRESLSAPQQGAKSIGASTISE
ncbi:hypothetical protein [Helicobacter zhangjianzhongii]|uniref:Uncharacterized protein n=1 Tax=Helicobacter zhangjianzhongii TaxID=2974574 RepID=A0ACC6FW69_9HELI|nr:MULTISPECIES: hypothetical protein [unclassified Helicobacter]MDL0080528.1 hypothetical protein [Helicobacter sp. CPD2-1]MDL0082831.1 hypothetical protein [Helicobacter sp. XJK30-2]